MSFSLRSLGSCLLGVALAVGSGLLPACGSDEAAPIDEQPVGKPGVDATIVFTQSGTIALAPGEIVDVSVRTTPPDSYAIAFLLVGEALDASLDQTAVVADPDGRAGVRLRAPNGATNFVLRAKIQDGPAADLQVAVSDDGFGTLSILPTYGGDREVREWVAQVVSGTTCEALASTLPTDPAGALETAAEPDEELVIDVAPVGPNLAVFVRAGHYMWGCEDESDLQAGEIREVTVSIIDKPIDASTSVLDVGLTFEPEEEPWNQLLTSQQWLMHDAFFAGQAAAPLLLSTMAELHPDPDLFQATAVSNDWLTAVNQHLVQHGIDLYGDIDVILAAGMAVEPPAIHGYVFGLPTEPGFAIFSLLTLGSSTPTSLGIPEEYVVSLSVDADDMARLGGALFWMPSRYLGAAAEAAALAAEPQHADFRALLTDGMKCEELLLTGLADCDASCMAALCSDALQARWQQTLDASANWYDLGEIPFQASGPALFDDQAALEGFEGTWLGKVLVGEHEVKVSGTASAETPADVPPTG